jgi:hypothetical protein
MTQWPLVGQDLLISEASRSHTGTPRLAGLLWNSHQPVADTLTSQHTQHSQEADIHAPIFIGARNPSNRAAADPRLRLRSPWDSSIVTGMKGLLRDQSVTRAPSISTGI